MDDLWVSKDLRDKLKRRGITKWDDLVNPDNISLPLVGSVSRSNKKLLNELLNDEGFQTYVKNDNVKINFAFEAIEAGNSNVNLIALRCNTNKRKYDKFFSDGYVMDGSYPA